MHRTGLHKRWTHQPGHDAEQQNQLADRFAQALNVHPLVARLLIHRGIDTPDAAHAFLHPRLTDLADPADLPGVPQAAARIAQAVRDKQPIVIYGDYDVDGITASAILWHTLKLADPDADVSTYIPHRIDEGYGLNANAIAELAKRPDHQTPLIITVDCGITAHGPAQAARELGVDLIITDHHTPDPEKLPEAHTLVHPGLDEPHDRPHTCPDLCGAGVAFKLAWHTARTLCNSDRLPHALRDLMMDLLSLVALGTVADVVPLRHENRVLTIFGLQRIKQTCFAGINAMIDAAQLRDEKIDAYHVGFVLGPRLNACGRMGHARQALELLTTDNPQKAAELANFLTTENQRRRASERAIFLEAKQAVLDAGYHSPEQRAIVLGDNNWHPGVIGIVASRLVEQFSRPVVMLNYDNGIAKGSARSVEGVCIHEAFTACAGHLQTFGGHAMAAGLTLATDNVNAFRDDLVQFINRQLKPEDLVGTIHIDAELTLADCTTDLFEQLNRLAPFGRGNPTPKLLLRDVTLQAPAQGVGRSASHLSLNLRQEHHHMRAIAFNMGSLAEQLPAGTDLDLVFEPKVSTWQGRRRAELHVKDLKINAT